MNDESTIVTAIIAAVSAITVGLMSLFRPKREDRTPSKREIYETQLNLVWEPIDKIFSYQRLTDPNGAFRMITAIFSENYKLIPNELINEVLPLMDKEDITTSDLRKIQTISSAYFHWTKRYLGYPYDRKKIMKEYPPKSRIATILSGIVQGLFYGLMLIAVLTVIIMLLLLIENDRITIPDWSILVLAVCSLVFSTLLSITDYRR